MSERKIPKTIYLTVSQLDWLDENVKNQSQFIRDAVDEKIEREKKEGE